MDETSHHGGSHHMGPPRQVVTLTHAGNDGNSLNLPGGDGVWEQHRDPGDTEMWDTGTRGHRDMGLRGHGVTLQSHRTEPSTGTLRHSQLSGKKLRVGTSSSSSSCCSSAASSTAGPRETHVLKHCHLQGPCIQDVPTSCHPWGPQIWDVPMHHHPCSPRANPPACPRRRKSRARAQQCRKASRHPPAVVTRCPRWSHVARTGSAVAPSRQQRHVAGSPRHCPAVGTCWCRGHTHKGTWGQVRVTPQGHMGMGVITFGTHGQCHM